MYAFSKWVDREVLVDKFEINYSKNLVIINGVKIINDFYTPEKVNQKFDVVISLGVLEHINGPHNFVKSQIESLKSNGILFFSVPNCENKLMLGDLKLLQHEHWNYFTRNSIEELLKTCGIKNIKTNIISSLKTIPTDFLIYGKEY